MKHNRTVRRAIFRMDVDNNQKMLLHRAERGGKKGRAAKLRLTRGNYFKNLSNPVSQVRSSVTTMLTKAQAMAEFKERFLPNISKSDRAKFESDWDLYVNDLLNSGRITKRQHTTWVYPSFTNKDWDESKEKLCG